MLVLWQGAHRVGVVGGVVNGSTEAAIITGCSQPLLGPPGYSPQSAEEELGAWEHTDCDN